MLKTTYNQRKENNMSKENSNLLFTFRNHWDESDDGYWDYVCEEINQIFSNGIYSMSSKAFGWDRDMACRIVEGNGKKLLSVSFDAGFEIFRLKTHWEIKVFHHDSVMGGDLFVIHKHKTAEEAQKFLRERGHKNI